MKVSILIVDDSEVVIASDIFETDRNLKCAEGLEFAYSLHIDFRTGKSDELVGIKKLHFGSSEGNISFAEVYQLLRSGITNREELWLIYLDLRWQNAGDPTREWIQLYEKYSSLFVEEDYKDRIGLALGLWLMEQDTWRGLLCIASGGNPVSAERFMAKNTTNVFGHRYWFCLKEHIRTYMDGAGPRQFREGVEQFEQLFGSRGLIRYWLTPPCGQPTWFHAKAPSPNAPFHNPSSKDCCQYKALPTWFGPSDYWEEDQGKFTKPLFELEQSALDATPPRPNVKSQNIKAGMVPLLFRNSVVLNGLSQSDEVPIPVQPGIPFLFAVKEALEKARGENEESDQNLVNLPLQLKQADGRVMVALRQSRDASGLVQKVNKPGQNAEDDFVSGAIHRALHAKVIAPKDLSKKEGCKILGGTQQPVAGVEWCASEKELRIYWPVMSGREKL